MAVITVNGQSADAHTLDELRHLFPDCDVVIYNGFQTADNYALKDGDTVAMLKKGAMPPKDVLEYMMAARHLPGVYQRVHSGSAAIAGLGGLGSHIAAALARTGVGRLLLVDFDIVEPSNLNRQHYLISHLGMYKTEAMKRQIAQINPYVQTEIKTARVNEDNACDIFDGYPIVCEAFDNPEAKAALVNTLLSSNHEVKIVAASGMAGYGSANSITTKQKTNQLYLCGDEESEARPQCGLLAPRVQICAGHQANMALRLLLGMEDV